MNMPLTADDVVVGIFYHFRKRNSKISADREWLHQAFYSLKEKYPSPMAAFTFRDRGQFPESCELDQAISNLDATGLICRYNVSPRYYNIGEDIEKSYELFSKKILVDAGIQEADVAKAAEELKSEVS